MEQMNAVEQATLAEQGFFPINVQIKTRHECSRKHKGQGVGIPGSEDPQYIRYLSSE